MRRESEKNRSHRPLIFVTPGVAAVTLTILLDAGLARPAHADRHCSFARESAFYAREVSAEALNATAADCPAKMREALDRLRSAMVELEICSCAPAEAPLRRWFAGRPAGGPEKDAACRGNAAAINGVSKTVLREVEKCF